MKVLEIKKYINERAESINQIFLKEINKASPADQTLDLLIAINNEPFTFRVNTDNTINFTVDFKYTGEVLFSSSFSSIFNLEFWKNFKKERESLMLNLGASLIRSNPSSSSFCPNARSIYDKTIKDLFSKFKAIGNIQKGVLREVEFDGFKCIILTIKPNKKILKRLQSGKYSILEMEDFVRITSNKREIYGMHYITLDYIEKRKIMH